MSEGSLGPANGSGNAWDEALFFKSRNLIRSRYLLTRGHTQVFFFSLANYRQIFTLQTTPAINRKGKRVGDKGGWVSIRHLLRLPRGKSSGPPHLAKKLWVHHEQKERALIWGFPEVCCCLDILEVAGIVHLGSTSANPVSSALSAIVRWALGIYASCWWWCSLSPNRITFMWCHCWWCNMTWPPWSNKLLQRFWG